MLYINEEDDKTECSSRLWPSVTVGAKNSSCLFENGENIGEFYEELRGKEIKRKLLLNNEYLTFTEGTDIKYFPLILSAVEDRYYWKNGQRVYLVKLYNSKQKLVANLYSRSQEDHIRLFTGLSKVCVMRNFNENYKLTTKITSASLGEVYNASHLGSNTEVVIKLYSKKKVSEKRARLLLNEELKILNMLKKDEISPLIEVYQNFQYVILVFHKACGGTLLDFLKNNEKCYNMICLKQILVKVLDSLSIIHEIGIIHRDLKPSNIMFYSNSDSCKLFLNDFGISMTREAFEDKEFGHFNCGTQGFIAPEVLDYRRSGGDEPYSDKSDMFSFGCIMYFLFKGKVLFENLTGSEDVDVMIEETKKKVNKLPINYQGKELLIKLLHPQPESRISASEVKAHSFFDGVKQTSPFTFCDKIYRFKREKVLQKILKQESKCTK